MPHDPQPDAEPVDQDVVVQAAFRALLVELRFGRKHPLPTILAVTEAAGRSLLDLVRGALADDPKRPAAGSPCPAGCGGVLGVASTRLRSGGTVAVQYVRCRQCGHRAGKVAVPAHLVPRRRPRQPTCRAPRT